MTKAWEEAANTLKSKNFKTTKSRRLILEKIFKTSEHFTAEELWKDLTRENKSVSLATVYRTLQMLQKEGLIQEHHFGGSQKYYETAQNKKHHDHFCCLNCGIIQEFYDPAEEQLIKRVAKKLKFKMQTHVLVIHGLCSKCKDLES